MKKPNSIDLLVENLALEFSKIKDFDLLQNDPTGKLAFNFVVKNAFELNAHKNLFVYSYIPSSLKSSQEHYRDWETDRKSTRLNSSHSAKSRMPSSA